MTYRRRNKKIIIGIVLILIIGYILAARTYPGTFSTVGKWIGVPVWSKIYPASSFFSYFESKKNLKEENKRLARNLDRALLQIARVQNLEEENKRLKDFLNMVTEEGSFFVAPVLSGPAQSGRDIVVVSIGQNHAEPGKHAYVTPFIIAGVVIENHGTSATIELFSSPGKTVSLVGSRSGTAITAQGIGGGGFSVDVPKEADIVIDDTFIIPETNTIVAFVRHIEESPDQTLKRVFLALPINVYALQELFIER